MSKITEKNIFYEAYSGNYKVLDSPFLLIKNEKEETPLHLICLSIIKSSVRLRTLLEHPKIAVVRDIDGRTPLHWLGARRLLSEKHINKKYPWYKIKSKDINVHTIEDILTTPNSARFIRDKE